MRAIYIADDGTQFVDKNQCQEYEREHSQFYKNGKLIISGLDSDNEKISFFDDDFIEEAIILYLATEKAVEIFKERCDEEGVTSYGVDEPGIYIWGDSKYDHCEECQWTNIKVVIKGYENTIGELKKLINNFKKN